MALPENKNYDSLKGTQEAIFLNNETVSLFIKNNLNKAPSIDEIIDFIGLTNVNADYLSADGSSPSENEARKIIWTLYKYGMLSDLFKGIDKCQETRLIASYPTYIYLCLKKYPDMLKKGYLNISGFKLDGIIDYGEEGLKLMKAYQKFIETKNIDFKTTYNCLGTSFNAIPRFDLERFYFGFNNISSWTNNNIRYYPSFVKIDEIVEFARNDDNRINNLQTFISKSNPKLELIIALG